MGSVRVPPEYKSPKSRAKRDAKLSLVYGILAVVLAGPILGLAFGIAALVAGYRARKRNGVSDDGRGGRGMAIAGIVLGWIGVAASVATTIATAILVL